MINWNLFVANGWLVDLRIHLIHPVRSFCDPRQLLAGARGHHWLDLPLKRQLCRFCLRGLDRCRTELAASVDSIANQAIHMVLGNDE